jgi:integrase
MAADPSIFYLREELTMPVMKLTQDSISKLRCPDDKRSVQVCDAQHRGLLLELRRTDQDHPTWYVRYRSRDTGKTRYTRLGHFPDLSLADARERAKDVQAEIRLGADPRADDDAKKAVPTFSAFFGEYLEFAKTRKRTWAKDEEYYRLRIKDRFGNIKLDRITRKQLQDFHTSLKVSGLASSTADHYLKLCKRVLGLAQSWGVIAENVSKGLSLFNEDNTVENYLNDEELKRLMTVLQTDSNRTIALIIMLLISSGVRKSEALLAQKKYINLETRVWRIPASTAKAKKMRSLPLSDMAMTVLREAFESSDDNSEYVFVNKRTGKPYTTIQKQWERIRTKAQLEHVRLHDLRHSFASYLANSGRTLLEIQTLLGHASPKVTLRYSHLSQSTLMDASNTASEKITSAMMKETA